MKDTTRFVTFPLGAQRYALDSCQVKELVRPSRVYSFPHTMQSLQGVLVRQGTVIPVCDLREAFGTAAEPTFYVVAQCNYAGRTETVAIPVSGNCEMVQGERGEASDEAPGDASGDASGNLSNNAWGDASGEVTFVAGLLRTEGRIVPLLDLDQVVAHCIQPAVALTGEAKR